MASWYVLTIETWPTLSGNPVGTVRTEHETATAAISALDAYAEPYHRAWLSWDNGHGQIVPCDRHGRPALSSLPVGRWWSRRGTNGEHPARRAMLSDWPNLVAEVRRRVGAGDDRGTVAVAAVVLCERHPLMTQCAGELGGAAVE